MTRAIGVYGGTFDPVHYGHLRTALEVKQTLKLDEVRLMPCGTPAHRHQPVASPQQRRRMLELALEDAEPGMILDDRELGRTGPSYMVDTLMSLREDFPASAICLIVGTDAFQRLETWSRWETLFELAHVIVMGRPGSLDLPLHSKLESQVRQRLVDDGNGLRVGSHGFVHMLPVTQLAISATAIRGLVMRGESARYLLPGAVLDYIRREGIYR